MSNDLPYGWGQRNNQMSEHDMKLGGIAATKFASKQLSLQQRSLANTDNNDGPRGTSTTSRTTKTLSSTAPSSAPSSAYDGDVSGVYKNSDHVRAFYLQKMSLSSAAESSSSSAVASPLADSTTTTTTTANVSSSSSNLPDFWEDRQKERDSQARQMGAFSAKSDDTASYYRQDDGGYNGTATASNTGTASSSTGAATASVPSTSSSSTNSPHVALVQVATHTLQVLATTLEQPSMTTGPANNIINNNNKHVQIPMTERAALANAMKRVMDVMSKQQS